MVNGRRYSFASFKHFSLFQPAFLWFCQVEQVICALCAVYCVHCALCTVCCVLCTSTSWDLLQRVAERLDLLFPAGAQSHKVVPKLEEDLASRLPFSFSHLVNKNTEAVLPSLPYEIGSTSNCAVSHHRSLSQDQRWLRWRVPTKPLDQKMLSYRSQTDLSFWSEHAKKSE